MAKWRSGIGNPPELAEVGVVLGSGAQQQPPVGGGLVGGLERGQVRVGGGGDMAEAVLRLLLTPRREVVDGQDGPAGVVAEEEHASAGLGVRERPALLH